MLHCVTISAEIAVSARTADLLMATRAAEFLWINYMTLWRWVCGRKIRPTLNDIQRFIHINELQTIKEQGS